jgi:hypothetical protein
VPTSLQFRRLAAFTLLLLTWAMPWGLYDYYYDVPGRYGEVFTGQSATFNLLLSMWFAPISCGFGALLLFSLLLVGVAREQKQLSRFLGGEPLFMAGVLALLVQWVHVFLTYQTSTELHISVYYTTLLPSFWLVPFIILLAGLIRFAPWQVGRNV